MFAGVTVLSVLAYWRALWLPLISDDYLQIALGRQYGPVSGWPALLNDALYRCRATSILVTHWTEVLFGTSAFVFNLTSLVIHIFNSMLVFAVGIWRPVGWRVAAIAAACFAVLQRHHEAVIWYAALPELLVFLFTVQAFVCWILWLQSTKRSELFYWLALLNFLLALFSKESAVVIVPLMVLSVLLERSGWRTLLRIVPFVVLSVFYFSVTFAARDTHLHFHDGTFALNAPFLLVMLRSTGRVLWFWGVPALGALAFWRAKRWNRLLITAAVWMCATLLPYSFLTYMTQVPSRHTYMASVSAALVIAAALIELRDRHPDRRWLLVALACTMILHQCLYLWTRKQAQFVRRAEPTEALLRLVRSANAPVHLKCFPYDSSLAMLAVQIRMPEIPKDSVIYDAQSQDDDAVNLCSDAP